MFQRTANIVVSRTEYAGRIVPMRLSYPEDVKQLYGGQTIQRLKKCIVKAKNILYEDAVVQIGFKSEPIYE